MDFDLPHHVAELAAEARAVGTRLAAGRGVLEDSWLVGDDPAAALELADRGWIGMSWPTKAGGGGASALERLVVVEALISTGAPVASSWFADRQIGPTLLAYGTEEQRRRWLPGILSGTARWCIGMSEPDAGSDVASLRTAAHRDGDRWVISGSKVWMSGAASAQWCYLVARTDPAAPPHRGLSEFVVDMSSPGIEVTPIRDATGNEHFCEVRLESVEVPADALVGTEGGSFRQIMGQMEHERGGIDRLVSNRALYERARLRAERDDPLIRQEIAALETGYRLGRLMVLREAMGQAPRGFSAATKTYCTELEQRIAAFCARVDGPAAMLEGRVARAVVYAPAYTIMGGTTQILRNILAERLLGLPR
ncbi:MAG: acyl-CoA dehydrogenase family protein [Microthrixaceae bacterium]